MLNELLFGFEVALAWQNLLFCFGGVLLGTLIGVLPGIGPAGALALLIPATMALPPVTAIIAMAGIYYGAMYGGSTTAILVNIPGEAASIVTTLDGYRMAQAGRAGPALAIAALGSFVAGLLAIVGLVFVAPPLADIALRFQSPEFVALLLFGLTLTSYVSFGSKRRAFMMAAFGLLLGTIGLDPVDGIERLTFGSTYLMDGIGLVPLVMGLFGVSEVLVNIDDDIRQSALAKSVGRPMPTRQDVRDSTLPITRGSVLGFLIGIIPGGNAIIASLLSYMLERKVSSTPERFGKGAIEGVAGPEAANNSAAVSAFVPLTTLGIPTNSVMALMLAGLMVQGVSPGPTFITVHAEVFWGLMASMVVGNAMLLVLNLPLIGLWIKLLHVPYRYLFPILLLFCFIGAYVVNNSFFDVGVMMVAGLLGYWMRRNALEAAPLILAFVLGPMLEENLRRTLIISEGSFAVFLDRPIALAFLGIAVLFPLIGLLPAINARLTKVRAPGDF
ncbi:MAG: tripartite tricarboxylate transporter permease [Burkholderiaceae bacterium]